MEPEPQTPVAIHHNTHLPPPLPHRDRHALQHARAGQNGQTQTPLLSTRPLVPHTGLPNTTLTCRSLNPDTAYIPHYIYSYLT